MDVSMMNIRVMRMGMCELGVQMRVAVGFLTVPLEVMGMLMVFVVNMVVFVCHCFMGVLMLVMFGEVEIDADGHQCASDQ